MIELRIAVAAIVLGAACAEPPPRMQEPIDTAANIILVAGNPSHGPGEHEYYAGCVLLAGFLRQNAGANPAVVVGAWPEDLSVFDRASAIVFFTDGNSGHPLLVPGRLDALGPHVARGVGLGSIHWAVHFPGQPDPRVLEWWGGHYSDELSVNPTWTADFQSLPAHVAARGVGAFEIQDEWYYNMKFSSSTQSITHLLSAVPPDSTRFSADAASHPGRAETTSWAFERAGGGRSFGFTGAHYHRNWGDPSFRRLVTNAILWIANLEVPEAGANVELDPADLMRNLDPK